MSNAGDELTKTKIESQITESPNRITWPIRFASLLGIVGMYVVFGLICSLIGFAAYFLVKSKIGPQKAIFVTVVVAAFARLLVSLLLKRA